MFNFIEVDDHTYYPGNNGCKILAKAAYQGYENRWNTKFAWDIQYSASKFTYAIWREQTQRNSGPNSLKSSYETNGI